MEKVDEIMYSIRQKEDQVDIFQSQIKQLEIKLEKLFYAKDKQFKVLDQFLESQYKRKQKYQEVLEISKNIRFMKTHSTRVLDIIHGTNAQKTEQKLELSRRQIDAEIYQTQIEIDQARLTMGRLEINIDQLYYERRKLSI
ncbi:hypothetical protein [Listeria booriae]|uniref:DUF4041 domain-containing protein n=1 Tax=Listeria booriae TaxID=1552123 RepID=A0A7X1CMZ1_9LIST|nr:hypothetical protein [Listeria booriae]MBC1794802.1 hypothetical protein [Listeria booriae]MBC1801834.1 hypothetical protein [Listeria booriae]MBC1804082.1 hypothetical protein [Listeria booriae]MBC2196111.1 hypothetical protein [Listeria booriae]